MKYVFSESLKEAHTKYSEQGLIVLWTNAIIDTGKSLVARHIENLKENNSMKMKPENSQGSLQKDVVQVALATGLLLMVPFMAMQFTEGVDWNLFDFAIMGTLLMGTGLTYVLVVKRIRTATHRVILGLVLVAALLLIWAELAVGVFGTPFAGS